MGVFKLDKSEFTRLRRYLGKTQNQLAQLLCVSLKAVQSFEQGWRKISPSAERQLLFLVSCKRSQDKETPSCWEIRGCPTELRDRCPAQEFGAGYFCWFITGTLCEGTTYKNWEEKIRVCRRCKVYDSLLPQI